MKYKASSSMAAIDLDKTSLLDLNLFKSELASTDLSFKDEKFYEGSNSNPYFLFLMHEVIRLGDQRVFDRLVNDSFVFSRLRGDHFILRGRGDSKQADPVDWEPSPLQLSVVLINARISEPSNQSHYGLHWSFLLTAVEKLKESKLDAFETLDDCEYYLMAVTYLVSRLTFGSEVTFRSNLVIFLINNIIHSKKFYPLEKLSLVLSMPPSAEELNGPSIKPSSPVNNSKWFPAALKVIEKYSTEDILKFKDASVELEEIVMANHLGVTQLEDVIELIRDTPKLWLQKLQG